MIIYVLGGLTVGALLGYGIAYTRYGNAKIVDELRNKFHQMQQEVESQSLQSEDLVQQNMLLRKKAQELLDQNEDYTKMISELTRYYYRIKQAGEKVKELVDIMGVHDKNIEAKIDHLLADDSTFDDITHKHTQTTDTTRPETAKYF